MYEEWKRLHGKAKQRWDLNFIGATCDGLCDYARWWSQVLRKTKYVYKLAQR